MIKAMVIGTDNDYPGKTSHIFYLGNRWNQGPYDNSEDHFEVGDIVYLDEDRHIWVKLGLDK